MFKNLTPHTVNLITVEDERIIEPSGVVARVSTIEKSIGVIDGVQVFELTYGPVIDLPSPTGGARYIVSKMVRDACPDRTDLFYPTRLVRDETGRIIGAGGLAR